MRDGVGQVGMLVVGMVMVALYAISAVIGAFAAYLVARHVFRALTDYVWLDKTEIMILSAISAYVFLKGVSYAVWERRQKIAGSRPAP